MAAIIYEKNTNGLIATGQRTVSTFDSGLVRVDRKYVCRSSAAATHRATLAVGNAPPDDDGAPCIDGLFIFPQPQELQRGDGFAEFEVSSYGRTTDTARINDLTQSVVIANSTSGGVKCKFWKVSGSIVIPYNTGLDYEDLGLNEEIMAPFDVELVSYPSYEMASVTLLSETKLMDKIIYLTQMASQSSPLAQEAMEANIRKYLRWYEVRFKNDGVIVPDFAPQILVKNPIIKATATRNFGRFTEISFISVREMAEIDQIT
jgi:hypothetical protein